MQHPYAEVTASGARREPQAVLKNLGGLSRTDKMLAMAQAGFTYTEIGKALKIGRGAVSGAIHRHNLKHGHVPVKRLYYQRDALPQQLPTYGYHKYTPDFHTQCTMDEQALREKLRKAAFA